MTESLGADLARGTAGELTGELATLLTIRTRVIMTGEGAGSRVVGIIVTPCSSTPHILTHP